MWNWFLQTQLILTIKFVVGCCDLKSNRLDGGNKTHGMSERSTGRKCADRPKLFIGHECMMVPHAKNVNFIQILLRLIFTLYQPSYPVSLG